MEKQIIVFLVDECIICIFLLQYLDDCLKGVLSILIKLQMHLIINHFLQNLQVIRTFILSCFDKKFDSSPEKFLRYSILPFAKKLQTLFVFFCWIQHQLFLRVQFFGVFMSLMSMVGLILFWFWHILTLIDDFSILYCCKSKHRRSRHWTSHSDSLWYLKSPRYGLR